MNQKNKPKDDLMERLIWNQIHLFQMYITDDITQHEVTGENTSRRIRACLTAIDGLTDLLNAYTYDVKPYLKYDEEESE